MTRAWSSHAGHMNTIPQVQDLQEIPSFQEDQWLPANDYGFNDTTTNNNNNNKQTNKQINKQHFHTGNPLPPGSPTGPMGPWGR